MTSNHSRLDWWTEEDENKALRNGWTVRIEAGTDYVFIRGPVYTNVPGLQAQSRWDVWKGFHTAVEGGCPTALAVWLLLPEQSRRQIKQVAARMST